MKRLAVIFPGVGYTADKPLLHVGRRLAERYGYESRILPYGGFPPKVKGDADRMRRTFAMALSQAEEMLAGIDWGAYDDILFMGKSIGTAVAAEVNGRMRLFQRVAYAGLGSAAPLSESLALSGKLREMTLSGVGTLAGEDAERVFSVLLSSSDRIAREAEPGPGTLTFVLKNGLRLQMTVSGETLIACGAWQCPAFFRAFREAL